MAEEMRVKFGDVGIIFRATLVDQDDSIIDTSSCTLKQLIFFKQDGSTVTKTASFYTDGSDGIIQYTTLANDLDVIGMWKMQAYIEFGSTQTWHSKTFRFWVDR